MKSFFKILKVERMGQFRCETGDQARPDIVNWIKDGYDRERLHGGIGCQTPADFEQGLFAA